RRRLPLEPDGRRLRQGGAGAPAGHRGGAARAHRGGARRGRRARWLRVIERLLELARRRADGGADALWRQAERTSGAFEWGRLQAAGVTEEAGANVRVRHRGRVGVAGTAAVDPSPDAGPTRALASAGLGQ